MQSHSDRLGVCAGRSGKPTIILDKNFHVWLTNPTGDSMDISAGELFGFGTGQYQNAVVQRSFGQISLHGWNRVAFQGKVHHGSLHIYIYI